VRGLAENLEHVLGVMVPDPIWAIATSMVFLVVF
jgi:hypothetical protein